MWGLQDYTNAYIVRKNSNATIAKIVGRREYEVVILHEDILGDLAIIKVGGTMKKYPAFCSYFGPCLLKNKCTASS